MTTLTALRGASLVAATIAMGLVAGLFFAFAMSVMPGLGRIAGAFALYVAAFAITAAVNIPLNDALAAAGPPERIADLAAVREEFEATWVRWNIARTVASTAAFGCLTWALVIYGRTTVR